MRVLKFGGTSVANAENILKIIEIVKEKSQSEQIITVVSAMGGITDTLIKCGDLACEGDTNYKNVISEIESRHIVAVNSLLPLEKQGSVKGNIKFIMNELEDICHGIYLLNDISPKTRDYLLSFGERLSSLIIAETFNYKKINTLLVDSRDIIVTDENFGNAKVNFAETNNKIIELVSKDNSNMLVSGFIASSMRKRLTTLGRGGSDYTAAIIAAALDVEMLEIWTDVSGVMTADPNLVSNAFPLEQMSYEEAMELSHFGAKVIYPPTIQPVLNKEIPILIKNTFAPYEKGTLISKQGIDNGNPVKGLSRIKELALLTLTGGSMVGVTGIAARLFSALSRAKVNVIFITQASSEHTISLGIEQKEVENAVESIENEFEAEINLQKIDKVHVEDNLSIVALVGDNMKSSVGLSGKAFNALGKNGINVRAIAQGSTERNISIVVNRNDVKKALNVLHERFFLSKVKKIHLFIVGVGNVGKTLLSQIKNQYSVLKDEYKIELKVMALANSKRMLFADNQIDLETWESDLSNGEPMNKELFVAKMKQRNIRNTVFIDNTANPEIAGLYESILEKSISVVCSNKIAASSKFYNYLKLNELAKNKNVRFLYETNVGAGLPVLKTIQDMVKSGDKITRIQAVLSGSLNFISNNFLAGTSFYDVVKQAMNEGYTEPDPRIDLSGTDVARKILILAREAGYQLEMSDIQINSFIPSEIMGKPSVEEFLLAVKENNQVFDLLRENAEKKENKLRFVAEFNKGKASVGLIEASKSDAYYHLDGKDNIVLIYSTRYPEQPMVIKGAGAGAAVTASGVFADIMMLATN